MSDAIRAPATVVPNAWLFRLASLTGWLGRPFARLMPRGVRAMAAYWGVLPLKVDQPHSIESLVASVERATVDQGILPSGATVVINDVPARVCENCGEEYVDEHVVEKVLTAAEASARAGVRVEIRDYVAA